MKYLQVSLHYRCNNGGSTVIENANKMIQLTNGELEWMDNFQIPQQICPHVLHGREHIVIVSPAKMKYFCLTFTCHTVRGDYFVVRTVEHFLPFFSLSLSKIANADEKIAQPRDERIAGPCTTYPVHVQYGTLPLSTKHFKPKIFVKTGCIWVRRVSN